MGSWSSGAAAVRGGRLVETASGLRDLATGLPAAFALRAMTDAEAARWCTPVAEHACQPSDRWAVDAWLTVDLLGRWVERVVLVSGGVPGLHGRRDPRLVKWLTAAAR